jgi:hypothetical protein
MAKKSVWDRNFAEDARVRDRIGQLFIKKIKATREQRQGLEDELLEFYNMWNARHDDNRLYRGRATLYIPEVRKNVESQARQLTEIALPDEDFFNCTPGPVGTRKGAEMQKLMRRFQLDQCKLRSKLFKFNRQEVLFGTSVAYVPWRKEQERLFRRNMDAKTKKVKVTRELVTLYNGPDFMPRSLLRWYAFNPKSEDFRKDGCVEFVDMSYFDLLSEKKRGVLWGLEELIEKKKNPDLQSMEELEREVEMLANLDLDVGPNGYAGEATLRKDDEDPIGKHLCAIIHASVVLPEACEDDEDPEMPIPVQICIYNGSHVGKIIRNPFWHQRPPYVIGRYILGNSGDPFEFYGQGLPWAIKYIQHQINSKAEQGMDASTLALNPLAFIDPGLAAQIGDFEVEPGAIWWVSPQGVKLGSIPDTSPAAYQAMGYLTGKAAEYSDRTPALPPSLQGKSRTATQSEIVDRAFQTDLKQFQRQNEESVLEPAMEMWESLTDQNVDDDEIVLILGSQAKDWKKILWQKHVALGRYRYSWKVSENMQSKAILSRQLIDFGKVAGSIPPEFQKKLNMQWDKWAKKIWNEGMGLKDGDEIFGQKMSEPQDPSVEHALLRKGIEIEVQPGDNDDDHMAKHDAEIAKLKKDKLDDEAELLGAHILEHGAQKKQKEELQKWINLQTQLLQAQAAAAQQQPGQNQGGKMQGSGNRTQLSPNSSVGNMGSGVRA